MNKLPSLGALMYAALLALLWLGGAQSAHAFDDDHVETINSTRLHFRVWGASYKQACLEAVRHGRARPSIQNGKPCA